MICLLLLLLACGEGPPGPCEVAWSELASLRDGMREVAGDAVEAPDEATFLSACRALPEPVRPCLSPRVALEAPDCDQRLRALDLDALEPTARDALFLDAPRGSH